MWERWFRQWLNAMFWWLPGRGRADTEDREHGAERPSAQPPDTTASPESAPAAPAAAQSRPQAPAPEPAEPVKPAAEAPKPANRQTGPAKKRPAGTKPKAAEPKAAAPKTAAPKAAPASQPDDLTTIKGLGPAMQQKLASVGVTSFAELAGADAQELTDKLKPLQRTVKREAVEAWIAAAREATKG